MNRRAISILAVVLLSGDVMTLRAAGEANDDARNFANSANRFGIEFFGQISKGEGNVVLSPFSIATAFAWLSAGADGATLQELERAFHLPKSQTGLHIGAASLRKVIETAGKQKDVRLQIANSMWLQRNHPFLDPFLQTSRRSYAGELHAVDFTRNASRLAAPINRWVEGKTGGRIHNLISPDALTADTRLVLANAIYLKAKWARPFEEKVTENLTFASPGEGRGRSPQCFRKVFSTTPRRREGSGSHCPMPRRNYR